MNLFSSFSMIKKLAIVAITGIILSACASTMEGIGKDMQSLGTSMSDSKTPPATNQSQTQGKDVVITPVK